MNDQRRTVGVIGVGHLMHHLVPGLLRAAEPPHIVLGPRNAETAADLAARFGVDVAQSSAAVVAQSDIVVVAVRPFQVTEALDGLPWRSGQTVLSLMAGVSIAQLEALAAPARAVRAMPVVAGAWGESATSLYPDDQTVRDLLAPCGQVAAMTTEAAFETASVFGATYGWLQALGAHLTDWLVAKGIDEGAARTLAAQSLRAAGTTLLERPETAPSDLVAELCLPGSITGLGLDELRTLDAFTPWDAASDRVLARLNSEE